MRNALGRRSLGYQQLPSTCLASRVASPGDKGQPGRILKLKYDKQISGWCGYYTMLNPVDGPWYDLSGFTAVSFDVRGREGDETFELAMADANWIRIGDCVRAGSIEKFLDGGVTIHWKRVRVLLSEFGGLDWSQMGTFSIIFRKLGQGVVYLDNIRFEMSTSHAGDGYGKAPRQTPN